MVAMEERGMGHDRMGSSVLSERGVSTVALSRRLQRSKPANYMHTLLTFGAWFYVLCISSVGRGLTFVCGNVSQPCNFIFRQSFCGHCCCDFRFDGLCCLFSLDFSGGGGGGDCS